MFGLFVSDEDKTFCKIDTKACITKHYGLVMYEKIDILQCKLVFFILFILSQPWTNIPACYGVCALRICNVLYYRGRIHYT